MSQREAERLLDGLENGGLSGTEGAILAGDLDPVLVYVIVTYLRTAYPASDPVSHAVLQRVVEMTSHGNRVIALHREGEGDPISRWFESEYEYRDFRGRSHELIALIVDKLES